VFTAARPRGLNRTNHDESRERRGPGGARAIAFGDRAQAVEEAQEAASAAVAAPAAGPVALERSGSAAAAAVSAAVSLAAASAPRASAISP
jgi:hypothetical protein